MRFPLFGILRLIVVTALGLTALAVGVSRAVPRAPLRRHYTAPSFIGVNGSLFLPAYETNLRVDLETGMVEQDGSKPEAALEYACCSPWIDAAGRHDVIGRLTLRQGEAVRSLCLGSGLAWSRDGDRSPRSKLDFEGLVAGRPCWFPGHTARVIVPSGNGRLYVVDFAPDGRDDGGSSSPAHNRGVVEGEASFRRLVWGCRPPGEIEPQMNDPICSVLPALRGRVIVTLNQVEKRGRRSVFGPSELWWLELDPEGTVIVAAGRLTVPEAGGSAEAQPLRGADERLANVTLTPDGRAVVAFLGRRSRTSTWQLMLAPLRFDPTTGAPRVLVSEARVQAPDVVATTPAFSTDGQWLYVVGRHVTPGQALERRPLSSALAETTAAERRPGGG